MSGNHNHSLDRALEIVEAAAKTGAHALKRPTYTADTITSEFKEGEIQQKAYTPTGNNPRVSNWG